MSSKAPVTPATRALDRLGVAYRSHPYPHGAERAFGDEAVAALDVPAERVFKTLVTEVDGRPVVAVVPVPARLDLGALARSLGAKRASMADPAVAERRTGYVIGGISPLGQRTRLPLVLDASAEALPTIYVSGGRRGFDIELAPADLLAAADGRTASITVPA